LVSTRAPSGGPYWKKGSRAVTSAVAAPRSHDDRKPGGHHHAINVFTRCGWFFRLRIFLSSRSPLFPELIQSSTKRRIAEDRLLPRWRVLSISVIILDSVSSWATAISFRVSQNASSRLTLVICPSTATERLRIKDFTSVSPIVLELG